MDNKTKYLIFLFDEYLCENLIELKDAKYEIINNASNLELKKRLLKDFNFTIVGDSEYIELIGENQKLFQLRENYLKARKRKYSLLEILEQLRRLLKTETFIAGNDELIKKNIEIERCFNQNYTVNSPYIGKKIKFKGKFVCEFTLKDEYFQLREDIRNLSYKYENVKKMNKLAKLRLKSNAQYDEVINTLILNAIRNIEEKHVTKFTNDLEENKQKLKQITFLDLIPREEEEYIRFLLEFAEEKEILIKERSKFLKDLCGKFNK